MQRLVDVDHQLAAVEHDGHRRVAAAQHVGDRRAARAGAGGHRLPHPALEDARADAVGGELGPERDVGAVRERLVVLDRRAELREVERLELLAVGDPDRRLRVADREVLEAQAADLAVEAHDRAAHVDAAGPLAGDRGADLARHGLDRVGVGARPAVLAQVQQRLARAVARQLGLGAVGVVDPQAGDVAGLVGGREREHAVGADAEVAVAQRAHARSGSTPAASTIR